MVNDRTDTVVSLYTRRQVPALKESLNTFLQGELQEIEKSTKSLADAVPQVADAAPVNPRKGMVRYAINPWEPLGSGQEGPVVYNGAAWKSFVAQSNSPAFVAVSDAGWQEKASGAVIVMDHALFNVSNCYDTSTGRFTAEIDGTYEFHFNGYFAGTHTNRVVFTKNGNQFLYGDAYPYLHLTSDSSVGDRTSNLHFMMDLSANDYFECRVRQGTSDSKIYYSHSHLQGRLIS